MTEMLLPCPFCGGDALHYYRPESSGWSNTDWVSCAGDCGAQTCMHENRVEAIAAWNRRAPSAAEARDALEPKP